MTVIFDDAFSLIADGVFFLFRKFRDCRKSIKVGCFALIAAVAVITSLSVTGATVAYRVNYDGKTIAIIRSKQQFSAAVDLVRQTVKGADVENAVAEPQYSAALVLGSRIDNRDAVAGAIIENTQDIVYAAALYVNGERVACAESSAMIAYLKKALTRFDIEGAVCTSQFIDTINVENGYYLASDIDTIASVRTLIDNLAVKTVAKVVTDTEIPYSSRSEKTNSMLIGVSEVTVAGQNGISRLTESITSINGVESGRESLGTVTVSEPVEEVVAVGTAKSVASAAEKSAAYSSGFIFPLPRGWTVSAYFGDGRGHKGVDLAISKGTSIYAAAAGTVIFSGSDSGYGNYVVIDHGNGLQTRYAHASVLFAKKGDTVSAGDVIAQVGSTGNSSGNHLHFEVIRNGTNVDPAPYIGLD